MYKMFLDKVTGNIHNWVDKMWAQRIIQVSLYASLLFYILGSYDLIDTVDKCLMNTFDLKLGKEGVRVLHALTFGLFMYLGTRFFLDPVVKRLSGKVEGFDGDDGDAIADADSDMVSEDDETMMEEDDETMMEEEEEEDEEEEEEEEDGEEPEAFTNEGMSNFAPV